LLIKIRGKRDIYDGSPIATEATDSKQSGGAERCNGSTGKNDDFRGSVTVT
jgi:hypothetical protein